MLYQYLHFAITYIYDETEAWRGQEGLATRWEVI